MAKDKNTTEKKPRKEKVFSPEIVQARVDCAAKREETELLCKRIMAAARQATKVRKLTEAMSPEQREALKAAL